ncbi:hypothetical protein RJ640_016684 [Escallonia rubra]|uniref:Uncharacterized protein n=1 Tax=Escallonia rubra TaxID=112253 RepID=A0AA88QAU4_9ASTE|nr:hypothetical protein RJ640_016684 [Escallonia rubra]
MKKRLAFPVLVYGQEPYYCPNRTKDVFQGSCEDLVMACVVAYPASSMPRDCKCTNLPQESRLCECYVVCGFTPPAGVEPPTPI